MHFFQAYFDNISIRNILHLRVILIVLRRDLLDENEAPQGSGSCSSDAALDSTGCTESYLDGAYDIAYSRIDRYMDTSKSGAEFGMKAQAMSSRSNQLETIAQGIFFNIL